MTTSHLLRAGALTLVLLMNAGCGTNSNEPDGQADGAAPTEIDSGFPGTPPIKVEALADGSGAHPKIGQMTSVHYTGTFLDGRKFDSSRDAGRPFTFPVGTGQVIKGWDITVMRMRVGDRWKVTIPYQLAYGADGRQGIPPKTDLVFDMELMAIR